jgi:RNA polymerase sigma factor (sigma-70 family)
MEEGPVRKTGREVAEALAVDAEFREKLVETAREKFRLDRDTALDLLQETAVILIGTEMEIHHPRGFVFQVFQSRCCRCVESQIRNRRIRNEAPSPPAAPPGAAADGAALGAALRQALGRVSPKCRELLRSHYWEGRTLTETAEKLSTGKGSVSTLVSRCLARLRRILIWQKR